MKLSFSDSKQGVVAIVGHAGAGHSNSHCGFIQDDSGGLTAVMTILRRLTGLDLTITAVDVVQGMSGSFTVHTASGGVASSSPRRGITAFEADLAQRVVGEQAVCSQALSMKAYGRTLGQGAMEVPVALQTAIANAAMDSFVKNYPDRFFTGDEGVEGNEGRWIATMIDVDGVPVALMGLLNATSGGIGPNEDVEGNVNLAGKAEVMAQLAMDRIPTIMVEGKVCASPVSEVIEVPTFVTRAYEGDDNVTVSECLEAAANKLGYPIVFPRQLLARKKNAMRDLTRVMGEHVMDLAKRFAEATTSREKVLLAAEINRYVSEDFGGVSFMSDDLHEVMGGVGGVPGLTGCLSLFVSNAERAKTVYPILCQADADRYADVILAGVGEVYKRMDDAMNEVAAQSERATKHGLIAK